MGGWEDYSKNKTNLSLRLVEVEAELGKNRFQRLLEMILLNIDY